MASGYSKGDFGRELAAVIGEAGVRQFQVVRVADPALWLLTLFASGLATWGIITGQAWMWIAGASTFGVGSVGLAVAYTMLARTLAPLLGRSAWWCANHINKQPARFVNWVDTQIAANTGSHVLADSPSRAAAVLREERTDRKVRRALRSSVKLRLAAVLLTAVPLLISLVRSHGEHTLVAVPTTPAFGAPGDNDFTVELPPLPSSAAKNVRLTACERIVRVKPVEATFGYIPGSRATTREIAGVMLPPGTPLSSCMLDQSAGPAVGPTTSIAYEYSASSVKGYVHRLHSSGWQSLGDGNYSYSEAGRSLQIEVVPVGKTVVLIVDDVK